MARRSTAVRLALPTWIGLQTIVGLVGAATVEPDRDPPEHAVLRPASVLDPAAAAGSVTAAPPTTPASTAPPPPEPAAPAGPGQSAPPAPGLYRYRQTTTGTDGKAKESERTTTATRVGQDGDDLVERVTAPFTTGSGESSAVALVGWGPKGVTAREWVVRLYGGSFTCDWQPDYQQYPAQLAAGASWSFETTCTGKVQGGQLDGMDATMRQKGTRKVTGTKTEQVGGRGVETWTVTGVLDLELAAAGLGGITRTEGTEQYAPSLGLPTSSDTTVTVDSFGQKRATKTVSTLIALP
jgi:hypothetical protein